jgi:O-acetyl-ADP-ribose deacetylase (regulator of RNase III)
MPLEIVRNDITKMHVDAIVNPTNKGMYGTAGVDGAIHKLAGPQLRVETAKLGICEVGEAKLTQSFNMHSKFIIHTVGPVWKDGNQGEEELLADCYRNSLKLALENEFESIAFPLISSGTFGYPKDRALSTAITAIGDFLLKYDLMVYLVVYDQKAYQLSEKLFSSVEAYIDDHYIDTHRLTRGRLEEGLLHEIKIEEQKSLAYESIKTLEDAVESTRSLDDAIKNIDDTFSEMLLRLIDERGLIDSNVYKKANVDRKLFSKIRNNKDYRPSKKTALAFAIALELNFDETKDLLLKAGFALSNSSKFDIIIRYFIEDEDYDIFRINETLFAFNQSTLGV